MSAVVRIVPSGHTFVVQADEPLLQAALRSGLALEFGCTNGSCGECKARVKAGEVRQVRFHDYVIREAEKCESTVLLCCCTADTDVTLEAGEARGPNDIPAQCLRARFHKQQHIGGVDIVHLRVMRGKMLRFLAGQHVRLERRDGHDVDISVASCPCDGLNLEFHFDAGSGGDLSTSVRKGFSKSDRFLINGPRGRFVLDETSERPLLFIACDTAIAPIKSIIEHAINLELPQAMHLYWHATRPDGHYLHNYFRSLTDALDDFRYLAVNGAVSAETLNGLPDLGSVDVYLAGSGVFVDGTKELLLARGLPEERLFIDALNRRPPAAPTAD